MNVRVFSLVPSLNDNYVDITEDEGSFEFSPKTEFTSPLDVHSIPVTDIEAESLLSTQLLQC